MSRRTRYALAAWVLGCVGIEAVFQVVSRFPPNPWSILLLVNLFGGTGWGCVHLLTKATERS